MRASSEPAGRDYQVAPQPPPILVAEAVQADAHVCAEPVGEPTAIAETAPADKALETPAESLSVSDTEATADAPVEAQAPTAEAIEASPVETPVEQAASLVEITPQPTGEVLYGTILPPEPAGEVARVSLPVEPRPEPVDVSEELKRGSKERRQARLLSDRLKIELRDMTAERNFYKARAEELEAENAVLKARVEELEADGALSDDPTLTWSSLSRETLEHDCEQLQRRARRHLREITELRSENQALKAEIPWLTGS